MNKDNDKKLKDSELNKVMDQWQSAELSDDFDKELKALIDDQDVSLRARLPIFIWVHPYKKKLILAAIMVLFVGALAFMAPWHSTSQQGMQQIAQNGEAPQRLTMVDQELRGQDIDSFLQETIDPVIADLELALVIDRARSMDRQNDKDDESQPLEADPMIDEFLDDILDPMIETL